MQEDLEKVHLQSDHANQLVKTLTQKNEQLLNYKFNTEEEIKRLRSQVVDLSQKLKEQTHQYSANTERLALANTQLKGELIERQKVCFDADRAQSDAEVNSINEESVKQLRG